MCKSVFSLLHAFHFSDLILFKSVGSDFSDSDFSLLKSMSADATRSAQTLHSGLELVPASVSDLASQLQKYRKKVDFLAVRSADEKIIRTAAESAHVDLINPVSIFQKDKGAGGFSLNVSVGPINHIVAKIAADNHIAFGFDFYPFLQTRGLKRSRIFSGVMEMIPVLQKYDVPIILFSGAPAVYDLRGMYELIAFGQLLGLSEADAKKAVTDFPQKIIEERRKILSGKKLSNGVEIVEFMNNNSDGFEKLDNDI
ncbi:RNase P subunit p30 family protein [Methanolapillus ohkumae]